MEVLKFVIIYLQVIYFSKNSISNKDKSILFIIGVSILILFLPFKEYNLFFITYIFLVIVYYFMFDIKNKKFIRNLILFYILFEIICFLQHFYLKITYEKIGEIEMFINIQSGIISFIIISLWKRRKEKNNIFFCKYALLGVAIAIIISFNNISENYLNYFILISILLNLIMCYFVILYFIERDLTREKIKEIESLSKYCSSLEDLNRNTRGFKHDFINILATMSEYFNKSDFIGLTKYFDKNILPLGKEINSQSLRLGLLEKIHIYEIKGILLNKVIKAKEKGINVFIDIPDEIDKINIDLISLGRIIGIVMDNAIEAAEESTEKIVLIGIFQKDSGINFVIENSFVNNGVYLYEMLKEGFSTKGENRGVGLTILSQLLKKYDNATIDTLIEGNKFIQHIVIY